MCLRGFMKISLLADYPAEIPRIAKWCFDEWAHKEPNVTLETVIKKISQSANRVEIPLAFIVHLEGELVGAGEIKYRELSEYSGFHYWLDGIYVPKVHRGTGISTVLIEYAKRKVKELKLPSLHLICVEHNVKLYESRGFRIVREEQGKFLMELEKNT